MNTETPLSFRCRWCGSGLNEGFRLCPVCQRGQGRLHGMIGPTSNWIAVIAAALTFGQLTLSITQANNALEATQQAELALKQVHVERSKIEEIKGQMRQIERSVQETSHATTEALLKIQAMETHVQQLGAARQSQIEQLTRDVESARGTYAGLQVRLSKLPPTIEVSVPRTVTLTNCINILGMKQCIPQPHIVNEQQNRPNPEFTELQKQAEQASRSLEAAETRLSQALAR